MGYRLRPLQDEERTRGGDDGPGRVELARTATELSWPSCPPPEADPVPSVAPKTKGASPLGKPTLPALQIEQVPVDALRPDTANPRRISDAELWALGDHRLLCGDATDSGDVARPVRSLRAADDAHPRTAQGARHPGWAGLAPGLGREKPRAVAATLSLREGVFVHRLTTTGRSQGQSPGVTGKPSPTLLEDSLDQRPSAKLRLCLSRYGQ